jgi:hypothetical protein
MLRHTEADIETVGKYDMEPGNTYIIQHSKEGLKSIDPKNKNITPAEINDYITRFRGKFVKYDSGKTGRNPNGIPGISNRDVAVFENVEIMSTDKKDLTDDIYVLFTDPREGRQNMIRGVNIIDLLVNNNRNISDAKKYEKAINMMLDGIKKNNKVAFAVSTWTFGDSVTDVQKDIESRTLGHLVNDRNSNELQNEVFQSGPLGPAGIVAEYLGSEIRKPDAQTLAQREEELTAYNQVYGNKRKFEELGGGRRRTRSSRRNKRGKTRKGKSRKSRTMKHRRHYRK